MLDLLSYTVIAVIIAICAILVVAIFSAVLGWGAIVFVTIMVSMFYADKIVDLYDYLIDKYKNK